METLIIICLLIIIVLMLHDKIVINRPTPRHHQEKPVLKLPEIMGLPKPLKRLSKLNAAIEGQTARPVAQPDNLAVEIEGKDFDQQIPEEELDEVFGKEPDLWEEEEEWSTHGVSDDDDGFASGVTFEELGTVEMVLREKSHEPSLQRQAVDIVHKIQGTELFSLLENSMEGASRKIAMLLDEMLVPKTDTSSSVLKINKNDDFDIGDFV